jgi:hypothetical protein
MTGEGVGTSAVGTSVGTMGGGSPSLNNASRFSSAALQLIVGNDGDTSAKVTSEGTMARGIPSLNNASCFYSAALQLIVRGLGEEAKNFMYDELRGEYEDKFVGEGPKWKSFINKLLKNEVVTEADVEDTVDLCAGNFTDYNDNNYLRWSKHDHSHQQDVADVLNHMILHCWTQLIVKETEITQDDKIRTEDIPYIIIHQVQFIVKEQSRTGIKDVVKPKLIRDLPTAVEYMQNCRNHGSTENSRSIFYNMTSEYFLVKLMRLSMVKNKLVKDDTAVYHTHAIKICCNSNVTVYGKLQSFVVHLGK